GAQQLQTVFRRRADLNMACSLDSALCGRCRRQSRSAVASGQGKSGGGGRDISAAEGGFHLAARLNGEVGGVIDDIGPFQAFAFLDVALELCVLREAERQETVIERDLCRRLLAPDAEATLAVEDFAGFETFLGGGDHVGTETRRRASRLLA